MMVGGAFLAGALVPTTAQLADVSRRTSAEATSASDRLHRLGKKRKKHLHTQLFEDE